MIDDKHTLMIGRRRDQCLIRPTPLVQYDYPLGPRSLHACALFLAMYVLTFVKVLNKYKVWWVVEVDQSLIQEGTSYHSAPIDEVGTGKPICIFIRDYQNRLFLPDSGSSASSLVLTDISRMNSLASTMAVRGAGQSAHSEPYSLETNALLIGEVDLRRRFIGVDAVKNEYCCYRRGLPHRMCGRIWYAS
jgi:hypothetical protein